MKMRSSIFTNARMHSVAALLVTGMTLLKLTLETLYRLPTKGTMVGDSSKIKSWLFTTRYRVFWEPPSLNEIK